MRSLLSYIAEEKNTHMTHIEDLLLDGGVSGARQAINALRAMRDMLAGKSTKKVDVTVKWDGAPAVFAGIDPSDGKFFVAKKGIFNKNPKVYKNHAEIEADTSGDLSDKLKLAFDELSKAGIKGVIQGDIMFTRADLKTETIDGVRYLVFHPNTIAYAVEANSEMGKKIKAAKIGIVFHTTYSGTSFENMSASYGFDVNTLRPSKGLWAISANLHNMSGTATMSKSETEYVTKLLSSVGTMFRTVPAAYFDTLKDNNKLNMMVNTFNNTYYRNRTQAPSSKDKAQKLMLFIKSKYDVEIGKLKTQASKDKKKQEMDQVLASIDKNHMETIFEMQKLLSEAKLIIINKLNTLNMTKTFVKTNNGYRVSKAEGFVAIDTIEGGAVKLVDRLEFSTNNFDPDIIKGWQSATRR